jgi:hypothetical protein
VKISENKVKEREKMSEGKSEKKKGKIIERMKCAHIIY